MYSRYQIGVSVCSRCVFVWEGGGGKQLSSKATEPSSYAYSSSPLVCKRATILRSQHRLLLFAVYYSVNKASPRCYSVTKMGAPCHGVGPSPGHQHTHTIIFLHGRDSTNVECAEELFESEASRPPDQPRTLLALLPTVKWVFPAAPILRSSRFDIDMSQWFDVWSVENPSEKAEELQLDGLRRSVTAILHVIQNEEEYLSRERIFLAGISQGFATALAAFFADGARTGLAGMVGLWYRCFFFTHKRVYSITREKRPFSINFSSARAARHLSSGHTGLGRRVFWTHGNPWQFSTGSQHRVPYIAS